MKMKQAVRDTQARIEELLYILTVAQRPPADYNTVLKVTKDLAFQRRLLKIQEESQ